MAPEIPGEPSGGPNEALPTANAPRLDGEVMTRLGSPGLSTPGTAALTWRPFQLTLRTFTADVARSASVIWFQILLVAVSRVYSE